MGEMSDMLIDNVDIESEDEDGGIPHVYTKDISMLRTEILRRVIK